jgi:hypothetical protein
VALPILALVAPAAAQSVHFSAGAIGGVRFSSGAPNSTHDESPRYAVGPGFELSVGDHLAVEVEALYRRFGYSNLSVFRSGVTGIPEVAFLTRARAHSLEIPVLGKFYFGGRNEAGRFFVGTGYSFQRSWSSVTTQTIGNAGVMFGQLGGIPTGVGAAFEAGWSRKAGPLAITPTFRYTHWGSRADSGSHNQAEFLLGLWF